MLSVAGGSAAVGTTTKKYPRVLWRTFGTGLLCVLGSLDIRFAAAAEWLPVSPDELQMTSEPQAPGAPAVILYRQVDRDDSHNFEDVYVRVKILTEAGLKYANVQIPFIKGSERISNLQARTIRPDGSVVNFTDAVYEQPILKSGSVGYLAKAFTLPQAEVGSILEYRYVRNLPYGWVFDSHWILSDELFTRFARFSLVPNRTYTLLWTWPHGLPPGAEPPKADRGAVRLEAHNVPAVTEEEYMPPETEVRLRVDFVYYEGSIDSKNPADFWKIYGKRVNQKVERFCDKRKAMEKAVAQVIAPDDPPEARVRKIYARMQQIHNFTFASESEREAKHEQSASASNVEDIWNRGYGDSEQITWLFLALLRAAGIDAHALVISTRDRYFFHHEFMNPTELNTSVVLVKLGDRDVFLDPGVPFTPFGLLPWYETEVEGLKLDKDGGTWLVTAAPAASDSRVERHGTFKFDRGMLDGKVKVAYTGLEASWRRLNERSEDATARRRFLEEDLQSDIPTGVDVKLTNSPDWQGWDTPLVAEYDLQVPGWAAPAGRRALLPMGLFGAGEKRTFEPTSRVHPMYFQFRSEHLDAVTIEMADPWVINSVPRSTSVDLKGLVFKEAADPQNGVLNVTRELTVNVGLVDPRLYSSVRQFYQMVRTADEAQAVLSPSATSVRR
jgi:Domain of Unknown Function with PDB structure (DUF3857)/Transglutaminase-like superfamily